MSEVNTGLPLKTGYVAAIARGHNSGVCLLKDGEVVFSIEEERLSRRKYDGGPYASMVKILEYTDKIDFLVIAHTQTLEDTAGRVDFSGDDVYTGLARKLGLIDRNHFGRNHPQVVDLSFMHHKLHAACAFYRSGWEDAVALIVDGAGTFIGMHVGDQPITVWEVESIIDCGYPSNFTTLYKHYGTREPIQGALTRLPSDMFGEHGKDHEALLSDRAGIVKVYEAVTEFCGWSSIEAGKTMGLFPYGTENDKIPQLFETSSIVPLSNRNLIVPTYPNGAKVNAELFEYLQTKESCSDDCSCGPREDVTLLQNRRDLAYACQTQTQDQVVRLIRKAAEMSGKKRVVISGGYGLNCVANYHYLEALKDDGIEIYCEPVSNDAGTAIGAAMMFYKGITNNAVVEKRAETLYLGPKYEYTNDQIEAIAAKFDAEVVDANHADIVNLLISKNIVAQFQGRSENGPRALGNRSFLFDPRFADGKDFVNGVKHREYFRPFAGSILEEHVHEWFDLRGMESSPTMMYAVNCQPGVADKIPSVIHVDGTCRIQTVNAEQNKHYYDLIKEFYNKTGTPMVFNTSFNLGGDPLVETLEDAVATLAKSEVEYLYLPEYGKMIKVLNY
jgi:carbamoyltransferase